MINTPVLCADRGQASHLLSTHGQCKAQQLQLAPPSREPSPPARERPGCSGAGSRLCCSLHAGVISLSSVLSAAPGCPLPSRIPV